MTRAELVRSGAWYNPTPAQLKELRDYAAQIHRNLMLRRAKRSRGLAPLVKVLA